MAYSGLETLYQNMGPAGASFFAGQREGIAQQDSELEQALQRGRLAKQQQEYELAQQANPLDLQIKQNQIAKEQAQMPGWAMDVEKKRLENQKTAATQASDIASTNSGNDLKVLQNRVKKMDDMSQGLGILGAELQQMPAAARTAYAAQRMQALGYDMNDPQDRAHFEQMAADADMLPQKLMEFRNGVITQGSQYRQAMDVALLNAKNNKEIHEASNKNAYAIAKLHEDGADRRATAKVDAKNTPEAKARWFAGLAPDKRLAASLGGLISGVSPITGEVMDEKEKEILQGWYDQDVATLESKGQAPGIGLSDELLAKSGLQRNTRPSPRTAPGKPKMGTAENPIVLK